MAKAAVLWPSAEAFIPGEKNESDDHLLWTLFKLASVSRWSYPTPCEEAHFASEKKATALAARRALRACFTAGP